MYDELIEKIKPYIKNYPAFLVGGYIRDNLSGKKSLDRDIVINCPDLKTVAKNIADDLGGAYVELDNENQIYRVVFNQDYIDFAYMDNIEDDIDRRDFTINSIAYDIQKNEIYDKNNGIEDYKNKIIKTHDTKNLSDDPLRMLRAYRFQAILGFSTDDNIKDFIQKNGKLINQVSKERIQQELMKMFEGKYLTKALLDMDKSGLLEVIFPVFEEIKKIPPNSHHHLDLFHHLVETADKIRINKPELKLAAFLHDLAKPDCWTIEKDTGRHRFIGHDELGGKKVIPILKELKFSNKQIEYISKMIQNHIYPSALMHSKDTTEKAIIRFVKKIGEDTPDLIELARADRLSARGEAVSDKMVEENLENLDILEKKYEEIIIKLKELPKLIDGFEIMEILNIPPSPLLKKIIDEIKDMQAQNIINTKEDAINYIKSLKGKI